MLDVSVLIEILTGSKLVEKLVDSIVAGDVEAYAARLSLTESLYVTCRLWGWEKALQRMRILMESEASWIKVVQIRNEHLKGIPQFMLDEDEA